MTSYWNHNTAYHPWLLRIIAEQPRARVLDVGCGDGLFLEKFAPLADAVVGLEPDPVTARRAVERLAHVPHARVEKQSLAEHIPDAPYDVIIFVASLHHMDLATALTRAKDLLSPGGELLVVGLATYRSPGDWLISALQVLPVRLASSPHPRESLAEIREAARELLPGAWIRRGLYYRYVLRWRKP